MTKDRKPLGTRVDQMTRDKLDQLTDHLKENSPFPVTKEYVVQLAIQSLYEKEFGGSK